MAWVKVPPENHPIFRAALPKDPRVETMQMFGGVAAKVNGHMFAGLFLRSWIVRAFKAASLLPKKKAAKASSPKSAKKVSANRK